MKLSNKKRFNAGERFSIKVESHLHFGVYILESEKHIYRFSYSSQRDPIHELTVAEHHDKYIVCHGLLMHKSFTFRIKYSDMSFDELKY